MSCKDIELSDGSTSEKVNFRRFVEDVRKSYKDMPNGNLETIPGKVSQMLKR